MATASYAIYLTHVLSMHALEMLFDRLEFDNIALQLVRDYARCLFCRLSVLQGGRKTYNELALESHSLVSPNDSGIRTCKSLT